MSKQKLLIYSDCYIYGGSERLMSFLVKNEILNSNYQIKFAFRSHKIYRNGMEKDFHGHHGKLIPLILLSNDTFFYKINSKYTDIFIKNLIKIPFWILRKLGIFSFYNSFVFLWLLIKTKPDILHINNGGFPAAASCNLLVFTAKICRIKKIFYQVNNQAQKTNIFNRIRNKKINQFVSRFITSSSMAKKTLSDNAGMDIDKISIIRNIVKSNSVVKNREIIINEFKLNKSTFILTQVAFLTERKGQIYLLKALNQWVKSSKKDLDFCLFLIGDGENINILRSYCDENDLNNKVKFLGYQPNYVDFIKASNLVVFPSISYEDLPLVIIESLMLGKCILGTSLAGISEVIVNNENGILVTPNVESLVEDLFLNIKHLYSNVEEIERIGNAAKISALSFSEEIYGNSLLKLYNE